MRAIYYGLALGERDPCTILLKWHGLLVAIAGTGCIARYLCDRKIKAATPGGDEEED
jgi:hypothetical protein